MTDFHDFVLKAAPHLSSGAWTASDSIGEAAAFVFPELSQHF
jgi:hypothetical protein